MRLNNEKSEEKDTSTKTKSHTGLVKPKLTEDSLEIQLKKDDMTYKYGWLSKVFGSNEKSVPLYIVALASTLLLLFSGIYTFVCVKWPQEQFGPKELWSITIPVLTSMLGYIFGVGSSKRNEE